MSHLSMIIPSYIPLPALQSTTVSRDVKEHNRQQMLERLRNKNSIISFKIPESVSSVSVQSQSYTN